MRLQQFGVSLGSLLLVTGCGMKLNSPRLASNSFHEEGLPSAQEAGDSTYRYAFSGQVLNGDTNQAIKDFSVALAGNDPTINSVINALGDRNGVFHVSRKASTSDSSVSTVPVIVSAPGFASVIKQIEIASDCTSAECLGAKPITIDLKPEGQAASEDATQPSSISPATVTENTNTRGAQTIFKNLLNLGKLDESASGALSKSKNKDVLNNVLVLLKGNTSSDQSADIVNSLLGGVKSDKLKGLAGASGGLVNNLLPVLATGAPGVGGAMLAVNALLPYLKPLSGSLEDSKSGPMGEVLATLLSGKNPEANFLNLAKLFKGNQGKSPQLAMGTFLPLVQGILGGKGQSGTQSPIDVALGTVLKDPTLMNLFSGKKVGKDKTMETLFTYLQPLMQGLAGKNSPEIATLFNELVKSGGINAFKNLPKDLAGQDKYALLLPLVEPLIRGLNSKKDGKGLAKLLQPLMAKQDPSKLLQALLTNGNGNAANFAQVATTVFPGMQNLLQQGVPGKQVFSAQLLQGLINGDFKDLKVVEDLKGSPGVVLSGQARDIFKIAQLANVEKIVNLGQTK